MTTYLRSHTKTWEREGGFLFWKFCKLCRMNEWRNPTHHKLSSSIQIPTTMNYFFVFFFPSKAINKYQNSIFQRTCIASPSMPIKYLKKVSMMRGHSFETYFYQVFIKHKYGARKVLCGTYIWVALLLSFTLSLNSSCFVTSNVGHCIPV